MRQTTKRQFSQRLRRVDEWTMLQLRGMVDKMVLKMCRYRIDFTKAYDCTQAHRTYNAVDRLLNYQDRLLYDMRYRHGTTDERALGRTGHGAAMELSPLWCTTAAGPEHRGCPPFTTSTAFSITTTGSITSR